MVRQLEHKVSLVKLGKKKLNDCEELPIKGFAIINLKMCPLEQAVVNYLKTIKNSFMILHSTAVGSGKVTESLGVCQPEKKKKKITFSMSQLQVGF